MKLKMKIASVSLIALAAVTSPAHAGNWATIKQGFDISQILKVVEDIARSNAQNTKEVERQVMTDTKQSTDRLIAALQSATGESSAHAKMQVEAQKRLMDAAELNETDRMRQQIRAEAESGKYDPNPDVCLLIDLFNQEGTTSAVVEDIRDLTSAAMTLNTGADAAVQAGGTAYAASVNADREAYSAVFDGFSDATTNVGILTLPDTLEIATDEQAAALQRLVRNMIDPFPPKPVTALEMTGPEGAAEALRQSARATRNHASENWIAWQAKKIEALGPSDALEAIVDDIPGYRDRHDFGDTVSEWQQLGILNMMHYAGMGDPEGKNASLHGDELQQAILFQLAVGNRINYLATEQQGHMAAMLQAILSKLNNG